MSIHFSNNFDEDIFDYLIVIGILGIMFKGFKHNH